MLWVGVTTGTVSTTGAGGGVVEPDDLSSSSSSVATTIAPAVNNAPPAQTRGETPPSALAAPPPIADSVVVVSATTIAAAASVEATCTPSAWIWPSLTSNSSSSFFSLSKSSSTGAWSRLVGATAAANSADSVSTAVVSTSTVTRSCISCFFICISWVRVLSDNRRNRFFNWLLQSVFRSKTGQNLPAKGANLNKKRTP